MSWKSALQVNNNLTGHWGPKWQKLNGYNKENVINLCTHHFKAKMAIQITPFPGAHPTNPLLCHSKVPDVQMVPWSQWATVEDAEESDCDENEEEFEEDEEVAGEEDTS
jgi:hypothetical protein